MKKQIALLLIVSMSSLLSAQDNLLSQARALFDSGKYSASQSILDQFSSINRTAEIMYLNARCSKELFLSDAISLYHDLNSAFPYHRFRDEVHKDLALIYYREKRYTIVKMCNYP